MFKIIDEKENKVIAYAKDLEQAQELSKFYILGKAVVSAEEEKHQDYESFVNSIKDNLVANVDVIKFEEEK